MGIVSEHGKILRVLRKSQSVEYSNSRVDLVVLQRVLFVGGANGEACLQSAFSVSRLCQDD